MFEAGPRQSWLLPKILWSSLRPLGPKYLQSCLLFADYKKDLPRIGFHANSFVQCTRSCSNKHTHQKRPTTHWVWLSAPAHGRTCGCQRGSVEDQPQCPGLWHSSTPNQCTLPLALPFCSPSFFHTISLPPAFTSA